MKAWWTDSTYLRDPMCNQLVSDYDYTKPYGEQKPYSKYYDGYETGAQCASIGIPFVCMSTINGGAYIAGYNDLSVAIGI